MKQKSLAAALVLSLVLLGGCAAFQGSGSAEFDASFDGAADATLVDQTYELTATVTNEGDESGEHTVEFTVDGETIETKSVELEPDETESVTFEHTFEESGEYDVAVDSAETTVTVADDPLSNVGEAMADVETYETEEREVVDVATSDESGIEMKMDGTGTGQYDLEAEESYRNLEHEMEFLEISETIGEETWYSDGTQYTKERGESDSEPEYEAEEKAFDDVTPDSEFPLAAIDDDPVEITDGVAVYEGSIENFDQLGALTDEDIDAGSEDTDEFDPSAIKSAEFEIGIDLETSRFDHTTWKMDIEGMPFIEGTTVDGEMIFEYEFVAYNEDVETDVPDEVVDAAA